MYTREHEYIYIPIGSSKRFYLDDSGNYALLVNGFKTKVVIKKLKIWWKRSMRNKYSIQKIMLPQKGICTEEELYFRREGAVFYDWKENKFEMGIGGVLSFDTYFNLLSATKWCKYTNVTELEIQLQLCGVFDVHLFRLKYVHGDVYRELLCVERVDTMQETEEVVVKFGQLDPMAQYAFQIISRGEEGRIFSGEYVSTYEMEERSISIAIVICTFKREKYLFGNLDRFKAYKETHEDYPVEIFVIDNAKTIDAGQINESWIHLFSNMNAGGSGGYTRGMLEVINCQEEKQFTHCILMDDDIVIDPAVVERTIQLLKHIKDEYRGHPVGGAMLRDDLPYIQFENGGNIVSDKVISIHSGFDLRKVNSCIKNESVTNPDYNAWWYCVIPMEYIRDDNLPMPMFVRYDDVEYGYRIHKEPILVNGICVWHDSFDNKYSSGMLYYDHRNRLIMTSVRKCFYELQAVIKDVKKVVTMEMDLYRYENALSILQGIQDFLKGPEWLIQQNPEELHKKVNQSGYKLRNAYTLEVPFDEAWYRLCCTIEDCDRLHAFVRKVSQNGRLLKANRTVIVPIYGARPIQFYRVTKALNYNENTGLGFVTVKDVEKYKCCKKELKMTIRKLKREYQKVVLEYQKQFEVLSSGEFWRNYLKSK